MGADAIYLDAGLLDVSISVISIVPFVAGIDVVLVGGFVYLVNCRSLEHGLFAYLGGGLGFSVGVSPGVNPSVNVGVGWVWNLPSAATYKGWFFNIAAGGGVGLATAYALNAAATLGAYIQGFTANPIDFFFGPRSQPYGFEFGWKGTVFPSIGVAGTITFYWAVGIWKLHRNHPLIQALCCPRDALAQRGNAGGQTGKAISVLLGEAKSHEAILKASAASETRQHIDKASQRASGVIKSIYSQASRGNPTVKVFWGG